ncbi:hypothetical protein F5Y17DRAFT_473320 [Xylariaceae sp. FL0594]|nr:hypothetical protein F5Y17DRAFT_473320 [Xylariaceae sp. FL0594]
MCQDIQKLTYACGHQVHYWWARSRFCLFTGPASTRFHLTYLYFEKSDDICPRCHVRADLREKGVVLPPDEYKARIESHIHPETAYLEAEAARFMADSQKLLEKQTPEQMEELNKQCKDQIAFYLDKPNVTAGAKVVLLRTVTMLPEAFDRRELVLFLGSRYFKVNDNVRQLQDWERKKIFSCVRHAGLEITLKAGMALKTPLPLPAPRPFQQGATPNKNGNGKGSATGSSKGNSPTHNNNKGKSPVAGNSARKASGGKAQGSKDAGKDLSGKMAKMSLK